MAQHPSFLAVLAHELRNPLPPRPILRTIALQGVRGALTRV